MRRIAAAAVLSLLAALAAALPAAAQTTAQGQALFTGTEASGNFDCDRAGCHAGASKTNNVNNIQNGKSWTAIINARLTVPQMQVLPPVSDFQAQAIACYIQSWFGPPTDPWCAGTTVAPPVCTLTASAPSAPAGTSVTLNAVCTNSPGSYSWTGCSSTGATCTATSATTGTTAYSVTATNTGGTSAPASTSVTWVAATAGALTMPAPFDFGPQPVGTTGSPSTRTITNASSAAVTIGAVSSGNPAEFALVSSSCSGSVPAGGSCLVAFTFAPSAAGARSATITVTSDGAGSPQSFALTGTGTSTSPPAGANYTGLWWNAPDSSESGWGLNVVHGGTVIFGTWFTYDGAGKGWWVTMILNQSAPGVFEGGVYETQGPPFDSTPWNAALFKATSVGTARLDFTGTPTFTYTVKGRTGTKTIKKQPLGTATLPSCTYSDTANPSLASNFTDIWYAAPANSQQGWGVNLTHAGTTIFLAWFTYDASGVPLWLVATTNRTSPNQFEGDLFKTVGSPYFAFVPGSVTATKVGNAKLTFANGNAGTFDYTVDAVSQSKPIVRQQLVAGYTVCN